MNAVQATVPVGPHTVVFMEDGEVLFRHRCDRSTANPQRNARFQGRDAGAHTIAPALQIGNGHTIVTREPLTIVASILCDDCGLHGWVTAGEWVPA